VIDEKNSTEKLQKKGEEGGGGTVGSENAVATDRKNSSKLKALREEGLF